MKKINFKNSSFIIFVTISLFYAIGNFIWWFLNTPIVPQLISACHFNDIFNKAGLYVNAPLMAWIMKGLFYVFGKQYFDLQIICVNYLLFLIALYFIYKTGFELKNKETGNIAMILFALTPAIYVNSVHYGHQDWHVMIAMVINIYCLIRLQYFKNRKWSILYGLSVGFGLLVKDEFLACFFIPWLYVVIKSCIYEIKWTKIINVLITILIGSSVAGCHYFRSEIISKIISDPVSETTRVFCFENFRISTIDLSEYLLSPPIFVLFIIGLIWFFFKYKNQEKWIILLWFIIPWTIITFMPHYKEAEYFLGIIPAVILIISLFISNIKNIRRKLFLIVSLTLICFLQYICFFYDTSNTFTKSFMGGKYFYNISEKLTLKDMNKLNIGIDLVAYIYDNSITKEVYSEIKHLDMYTLQAISNSCFDNALDFVDIRFIDNFNFDIIVIDDNSVIEKDTLKAAEQAYQDYIASVVSSEEFKQYWIKKRIEETEKIKSYFYNNNFVMIKKFLFRDSFIRVYKLEK